METAKELEELRGQVRALSRRLDDVTSSQEPGVLRAQGLDIVDNRGRVRIHVGRIGRQEDLWEVELRSVDGSPVGYFIMGGGGGEEEADLHFCSGGNDALIVGTRWGQPWIPVFKGHRSHDLAAEALELLTVSS